MKGQALTIERAGWRLVLDPRDTERWPPAMIDLTLERQSTDALGALKWDRVETRLLCPHEDPAKDPIAVMLILLTGEAFDGDRPDFPIVPIQKVKP